MKAVDSNLLVYASLANHPAALACEQYFAGYPLWLTNTANLVEVWRVLFIRRRRRYLASLNYCSPFISRRSMGIQLRSSHPCSPGGRISTRNPASDNV